MFCFHGHSFCHLYILFHIIHLNNLYCLKAVPQRWSLISVILRSPSSQTYPGARLLLLHFTVKLDFVSKVRLVLGLTGDVYVMPWSNVQHCIEPSCVCTCMPICVFNTSCNTLRRTACDTDLEIESLQKMSETAKSIKDARAWNHKLHVTHFTLSDEFNQVKVMCYLLKLHREISYCFT